MSVFTFDPNNTILPRMGSLSRTEAVELGRAICAALPAGTCHGAIWPGAVMPLSDGAVALDAPLEGEILNLNASALEFTAPELFWNDTRSPAADVYSIGLILYCAMNGGVHPFYPAEGEADLKARSDALRRRMKGEPLPALPNCGKKLGAVIQKAVAYEENARYQTPAELKVALDDCPVLPARYAGFTPAALADTDPELAAALDEELGLNSVAEAQARAAARKEYKVDKEFEPTTPIKKKKGRGGLVLAAVLLCAAVLALLALRACGDGQGAALLPGGSPPPAVSPALAETVSPAVSASPDVSVPPAASASPAISASPDVSASPAVTPSPVPTAVGLRSVTKGSYTAVLENVSWETARARCEAMGGHLAVIHNQEELDQVAALAEELGASYVWLGARRSAATGEMEWVTGEEIDFYAWDLNEPSYKDGYDGTPEDYLLLWKVSFGDHSGWKYNDSRPDLYGYSSKIFGGKIAYICQKD